MCYRCDYDPGYATSRAATRDCRSPHFVHPRDRVPSEPAGFNWATYTTSDSDREFAERMAASASD